MRSIRFLAVATGAVLLGSACGGGSDVGPNLNDPPAAGFTEVCTQLSCVFTDASTDPDGNATITARSWNFGDNTPPSGTLNPTHVYAAAGQFTVALTVTDDQNVTNTASKVITVTATPVVTPPTAAFTVSCGGLDCSFTNTSTGVGTLTYRWAFGDGAEATDQNPAHTYNVTQVTPFTVTLTVTDGQTPSQTATTSQTITVTPAATLECPNGTDCTINITQRSTVKITLTSHDCELGGNRFEITEPVSARQVVFFNMCSAVTPLEYILKDRNGAPIVFDVGAAIQGKFVQGVGDANDPPRGPPAIRLTGTYPTWTIEIDDGGVPEQPRDFNDIVMSVQATAAQ